MQDSLIVYGVAIVDILEEGAHTLPVHPTNGQAVSVSSQRGAMSGDVDAGDDGLQPISREARLPIRCRRRLAVAAAAVVRRDDQRIHDPVF